MGQVTEKSSGGPEQAGEGAGEGTAGFQCATLGSLSSLLLLLY